MLMVTYITLSLSQFPTGDGLSDDGDAISFNVSDRYFSVHLSDDDVMNWPEARVSCQPGWLATLDSDVIGSVSDVLNNISDVANVTRMWSGLHRGEWLWVDGKTPHLINKYQKYISFF